jgi:8-oxo-dGTP pyrophosphatase MutT (NUDIX family)
VGETLHDGLCRELREEIGIDTTVGSLIELSDRLIYDDVGRVRYYFALTDYLCHRVSGEVRVSSDAEVVALADLAPYALIDEALSVIFRGRTLG